MYPPSQPGEFDPRTDGEIKSWEEGIAVAFCCAMIILLPLIVWFAIGSLS